MLPEINISGFIMQSWDICLLLSYLIVTALLIARRPKDFPLSKPQILTGSILFFIMAVVGAFLLHLILYIDDYRGMSLNGIINNAGAAYLGAPLLGFSALLVFCRELKVSFLEVMDFVAPYLMLSRAIGRLGCLLAGCCHGIASELPWAQYFGDGILRHPTQAYALPSLQT
jgi:phosphatidylglycerol:prolipoprotein diacylglycerol transferase